MRYLFFALFFSVSVHPSPDNIFHPNSNSQTNLIDFFFCLDRSTQFGFPLFVRQFHRNRKSFGKVISRWNFDFSDLRFSSSARKIWSFSKALRSADIEVPPIADRRSFFRVDFAFYNSKSVFFVFFADFENRSVRICHIYYGFGAKITFQNGCLL